ncbi:hypothetical protein Dimus_021144 [Dionaea muscipula]
MDRNSNLLDAALGLDDQSKQSTVGGQLILIEDCVEISGAFVIHHMVKRSLCSPNLSGYVIFVALSQPFTHYDRILRKLGCNLAVHRDNKRFFFFDMLLMESSGGDKGNAAESMLMELYGKIQNVVETISSNQNKKRVTILLDDFSLLEVAANGASYDVVNFLHYCQTLCAEYDCCLVILNHEDIYSELGRPLLLQIEYLADILINAEPLATGVAADVHGQLTVINKKGRDGLNGLVENFHFKLKENGIQCFLPGTQN